MNYLKKHRLHLIMVIVMFVFYNFYFIYLVDGTPMVYLLYLDFLILFFIAALSAYSFYQERKQYEDKKAYLASEHLIASDLREFENSDIALHDREIYQNMLQEQYDLNQELQDYIAKWCHEIKIPLAASLLIAESSQNEALKEQLEKMNMQLNTALLGCKVQGHLYDIQFKKVDLLSCVQTSVKNNRYFLIKKHFDIKIDIQDIQVYSDKEWLVYILDQIIANAVKYSSSQPQLKIWAEKTKYKQSLYIEDNGMGISEADLPRVLKEGLPEVIIIMDNINLPVWACIWQN